ncbi:MAG: HIT family protein [bacterium]|nr:HIT family protein [bacterium]MCP5070380.1 HIT family protein [bacterium]
MNVTGKKFGHPDTLLAEFDHWVVLLRPAQVTLGSLVLLCTDEAERFGDISAEAATELKFATTRIEEVLTSAFGYDKINYLMLMMVDPDVHFHVIPRYERERSLEARAVSDIAWPGPPDVTSKLDLSDGEFQALLRDLRARFG